ncbi:RING finger protein [Mycena indigotica]|uniref:RING finger protein n=1 Tax=Mycena indigotica TaxID=2126181 RepID=A0A8H6S153_9AGAR|nr:RING finger protein [Mycena indigotica]KAF7289962.1 RING finger protein [Mycena indigotica]
MAGRSFQMNGTTESWSRTQTTGQSSAYPIGALRPSNANFKARSHNVCRLFLEDRCARGNQCNFAHPSSRRHTSSQPLFSSLTLPHNLPPSLTVKLPNTESLSDPFNSQTSMLNGSGPGPPLVRLGPSPPFLPVNPQQPPPMEPQDNAHDVWHGSNWESTTIDSKQPQHKLWYNHRTSYWGTRPDEKAWTEASFSSDDTSTSNETKSSAPTSHPIAAEARAPSTVPPCHNWQRGVCTLGSHCRYLHGSASCVGTDETSTSRTLPIADATPTSHPTDTRASPTVHQTCRKWLRGVCSLGNRCRYLHGHVGCVDTDTLPSVEPPHSVTIHDHTQVTIAAGFEVLAVTTGMETPWITLSNLPVHFTAPAIHKLLRQYGLVEEVKISHQSKALVQARFSCYAEALRATAALDGAQISRSKISARISVNSRSGAVSITDTSIRIQWEAPQRIAYGGYSSFTDATTVIAATKKAAYGDYMVKALIHEGLPSIGVVTVKFSNLPPDADEKFLGDLGPSAADVMWERPNYAALPPAVDGVRTLLRGLDGFLNLEVAPPPHYNGLVRAWARFSSATAAKAAVSVIHGRKPLFIGKKTLYARHIQFLEYELSAEAYAKHEALIELMRSAAIRNGHSRNITIRHPSAQSVKIKLLSESISDLGFLKVEFEKILRGEIVRSDGVAVWDGIFACEGGSIFLRQLEVDFQVRVEVNALRQSINLFGTPLNRASARTAILERIAQSRAQRPRKIHVRSHVLNNFITTQHGRLCRSFGAENIVLIPRDGLIIFYGGDELYKAGIEAIHRAQQSLPDSSNFSGCPICFNKYVAPVTLSCGHTWCRNCLSQYLLVSVDHRRFPLTCLGGNGQCHQPIPLSTARNVLTPNEFNMLVDTALSSYVRAHAKELHHCPTPDCLQIYRTGPEGTVVQCPSCLVRICTYCHVEAHEGFPCAEQDGGDRSFKEWVAEHDVKHCPGCEVPIERDKGCHHVTCSQCQTHICWMCLRTFPKGDGIYQHMRAEHGGIGLVQDDL